VPISSAPRIRWLDKSDRNLSRQIPGHGYHLAFVENQHPMVQLSTQASYRLMMHGLDCEALRLAGR
jgi:hypothetical protein